MTCHYNDVVVVLFPFVDRSIVKPRPALVLSADKFNGEHGQIIVAMITTAARSAWPSDVPISDLASAGLKHPSVVRWKVFTVSATGLGPRIGELSLVDRQRVGEQRHAIFGDNRD